MENKKIYAVTGGIGSGKSEVLSILSTLGFTTLSCDEIYKNLITEETTINLIAKVFPDCVDNGKLNTKKLSAVVFADKEQLDLLNAVTHPLILKRLFDLANESNNDVVFAEVPLYFESNLEKNFAGAIVVTRNLTDRIESVKVRSNLSNEQVLARINSQFDYDNADLTNYFIIENNGDLSTLTLAVKNTLKTILE